MLINKLKAAMLCMLAANLLFSTACQPTPGSEAVAKKGSELEDKVLETAQSTGEFIAHEGEIVSWDETRTVNIENMGEYTVNVSMDANIPELPDKAPVFLIEPKEFSIDFMKRAAEYLLKGEIFDGKESKEDVAKELLDFKKDIGAHSVFGGYQEQVDERIEFLNKRYDAAAETNGEPEYEYKDNESGEKGLHLKSYPNENSIMYFSAFKSVGAGLIDNYFFRTNEFGRSFICLNYASGENIQANGVKATYKQALATADKTMADLFEEPFVMVHSELNDIINDNEFYWNYEKGTSEGQVYVFYYTRKYDDAPSLLIDYAPSWESQLTEEQYNKPYYREGAYIVVDDRGIVEMKYDSYSGTIKKLNDNVALMPFDEILERLKDGVFYHSMWGTAGSTADIKINIIEFGMVREPVKDNPRQFMMVPAWSFIGDIDNIALNESGACEKKCILALNAVNGSIITYYQPMVDPK